MSSVKGQDSREMFNLTIVSRFDPNLNSDAGLTYKSLLSMPILEEDTGGEGGVGRVLGVISLINKEKGGVFTENDERFAEAFSLFCGMAIRNAAAFERAAESEAKLQVKEEKGGKFANLENWGRTKSLDWVSGCLRHDELPGLIY